MAENFYDKWLGLWDQTERERQEARRNIHEEELEWVETVQDHRSALMVSRDTGFRTWGGLTMLSEIPPHSHSGAHKHGEEAIFIVKGSGSSIIDGIRYDWARGASLPSRSARCTSTSTPVTRWSAT